MKRSWKWIVLEVLFWAAVSIGTAVLLVALSDRILPANF